MADREISFPELIRLVSEGDHAAYSELVGKLYGPLVQSVRGVWNADTVYGLGVDPEDLVQSFFMELAVNPNHLKELVPLPQSKGAFHSWAMRRLRTGMAALRSRARGRKGARTPLFQSIYETDPELMLTADPERQYLLQEAVDRLPEPERDMARLRESGYSLEEVAQRQGVSVMQANVALERTRVDLLSNLGREPIFALSAAQRYRKGRLVAVFYATDRARKRDGSSDWTYGNHRAHDGALSYGMCYVNVPHPSYHRVGRIERPARWWGRRFEDPAFHFMIHRIIEVQQESMFEALSRAVAEADRKEVFVFIHGYNVSFVAAAYRAAQLALDLKFSGSPILFSWASAASTSGYMQDEETVRLSVDALKGFLHDLARKSGATTIHLIAHSMGTRALADAMHAVSEDLRAEVSSASAVCRIRQIVLAAPDINIEVFRKLAAAMVSQAERVTLYACARDKALALSRRFHRYPRAGEILTLIPGVDTIESSAVDTSFLGHGLFATNRAVLTDLGYLLNEGIPPDRRIGLNQVITGSGKYWAFQG